MIPNASYHDRLVKHYGVTRSPDLGGFLLPDGTFLDFSEGSGMRSQDHRNVTWALPHGTEKERESRYDGMVRICKRAQMYRWMPEAWALETWTLPTAAQLDAIEQLAKRKTIMIEAYDGRRHYSAEYEPWDAEDAWRDLLSFYRGKSVKRNPPRHRSRRGKKIRLTVLLPVGVTPNGSTWRDYVRGEWWLDSTGRSTFADQDIGEAGHEQIAIDHMVDAEELIRHLAAWYRSKGPLSEGWSRKEANDKADELEGRSGDARSSEIVLNEYVPESVGAKAAGSKQRWLDVKEDARAAYAKYEGAILAIDNAFAAWKVTESTIAAIQTFLSELVEDEEIDDPSTKVLVEQIGPPKKWASMPIAEFMLIRKPKELFR